MEETTHNSFAAIDANITEAVRALVNKQTDEGTQAYKKLLQELSGLSAHSQQRSLEKDARNSQRWLAASATAILQCSDHGANACFAADSTKMSEALSINNATFKKGMIEDGCPDVTDTQRILLASFQQDWERNVQPLLAERILAYGKEKLAAEGYTRLVREWFDANRKSHVDMTAPHAGPDDITGDYSNFLHNLVGYGTLLETIRLLNKNEECKVWLDTLSNSHSSTDSTLAALEKAAELYEADERLFSDNNIVSMKEAAVSALTGLQNGASLELVRHFAQALNPNFLQFLPKEQEIHHLHAILQDFRHGLYALVETPFYSDIKLVQER